MTDMEIVESCSDLAEALHGRDARIMVCGIRGYEVVAARRVDVRTWVLKIVVGHEKDEMEFWTERSRGAESASLIEAYRNFRETLLDRIGERVAFMKAALDAAGERP